MSHLTDRRRCPPEPGAGATGAGRTERMSKPDALPDGFKMTELGPLPAEWRVVRLGEVANVQYGKTNSKSFEEDIPVIGSGGIFAWTNKALVNSPTIVVDRKGTAGEVHLAEQPSYPRRLCFSSRSRAAGEGSSRSITFPVLSRPMMSIPSS